VASHHPIHLFVETRVLAPDTGGRDVRVGAPKSRAFPIINHRRQCRRHGIDRRSTGHWAAKPDAPRSLPARPFGHRRPTNHSHRHSSRSARNPLLALRDQSQSLGPALIHPQAIREPCRARSDRKPHFQTNLMPPHPRAPPSGGSTHPPAPAEGRTRPSPPPPWNTPPLDQATGQASDRPHFGRHDRSGASAAVSGKCALPGGGSRSAHRGGAVRKKIGKTTMALPWLRDTRQIDPRLLPGGLFPRPGCLTVRRWPRVGPRASHHARPGTESEVRGTFLFFRQNMLLR